MPEIQYGRSAYARNRGSMPELPLVNIFVEQAPADRGGVILQSRKGLVQNTVTGSGPVRGTFQRDGILNGSRITVSGSTAYSGASSIGGVSGAGHVSIDGDNDEVMINAGGPIYRYVTGSFAAVDFPDGANVTKVMQIAGYFLAIRAGTQRIYFSPVGGGLVWDGLDYFSAESEPDQLLDIIPVNDGFVALGTETIEFFTRTGNADLPFAAIEQRTFKRGAIGTGCAVAVDNSFIWVGNDKIVYRGGNVPEAISQDGHSERLNGSETFKVYLVDDERHKFVCIRLDSDTLVFDVTTGQWCEFESYGRENFRGLCADGTLIGDDETGALWQFSDYTDAGGVLERRLRGGFPIDGGAIGLKVVRVRTEVGGTAFLTGDYVSPQIEMRLSNDYGKTWTDWEAETLGEQGEYRTMPEWRALGMGDYPGVLFEWRVTDPVGFRFSGAMLNEPHGGMARG